MILSYSDTPLTVAVAHRHEEIVSMLVKYSKGKILLHIMSNLHIFTSMLEIACSVNTKNINI